MADGRLFSVGGQARLYIARQNSRPPPSSAALRPLRFAPRCRSGPPAAFRRHEGRDGRGRSDEGKHHDDRTRRHRLRAAAHLIPDRSRPRRTPALRLPPLPGRTRPEATARSPDASPAPSPTSSTPSSPPWCDTRLEPDLEDLLWSTVNLFHRATGRIERELDDNEQAQKRSQKEQDGSEIRSVELERLTAEGQTLIERRNSMEFFRDQAADQFERHTHSAWRPRSGSMVNHRT